MPSAVIPNPRAAPDGVDNRFNYDDAVEDFLKDLPIGNEDAQNHNTVPQEPAKDIDEEITVKKKRKPVPKLDEARLLSDAGLPRLRKITKTRLKFRGKGHEFSDISRLLNTYQLWLDDLFPRAKFKDALIDVEKIGHTKSMQARRRGWLDATKPRQRDASPEMSDDVVMSGGLPATGPEERQANEMETSSNVISGGSAARNEPHNGVIRPPNTDNAPDDDELDALLAESSNSRPMSNGESLHRPRAPFEEDDSDNDDLNALLAAERSKQSADAESGRPSKANEASQTQKVFDDEFAAEEEAMADMDMW